MLSRFEKTLKFKVSWQNASDSKLVKIVASSAVVAAYRPAVQSQSGHAKSVQ